MTTTTTLTTGIVKNILSSDTLVIRGKSHNKERLFHLDSIQTIGRLGNLTKPDDLHAFEAREYLRTLLVGKEVQFQVTSQTNPQHVNEYGILYANDKDVAVEVVRAGWANVKDSRGSDQDDPRRIDLLAALDEARVAQNGQFSPAISQRIVHQSMPEDPVEFLASHRAPIDAIIESVTNGGSARVRLLLSANEHQIITLRLAGVLAPRASNAEGNDGEEFGDEAKSFLETRILQRSVKVTLLSLPAPPMVSHSFSSTATPAPAPPATAFIGSIQHPAGNIAALLVGTGLVRIVDWHAGFLRDAMPELRKAESSAKASRVGHWRNLPAPVTSTSSNGTTVVVEKIKSFEGVVTRVWGADLLSILPNGSNEERRIQFASIRQPKPVGSLAGIQAEGKELLRKKLIGKLVHVTIDYIKAADGNYDAQECATIKVNGLNVAVQLIHKGFVSVIRHRSGEDKSSCYDELLVAESKSIEEKKGIHSGKESLAARPLVDASESAAKAAPFLSAFKRGGRTAAIVDYVAAGSRFKILVPKHNVKATLVLGSIRCPRTARNANEKGEPFGVEAATFVSRLVYQRDVEVVFDNCDKTGGFIGSLYLNGQDVAELLIAEGLARLDEYASPSKALIEAEAIAKAPRKNIWKTFDAEIEAVASERVVETLSTKKEYVDVVVSDTRGDAETGFSFSVQILNAAGIIPELERLMTEINQSIDPAPANYAPRHNDLVCAQFSADNAWYRGRVKKSNPAAKQAEILYIDYGNTELLHYTRIRPLPPAYKQIEAFSKDAQLSFVSLLDPVSNEYGMEAIERFKDYTERRNLVAVVDLKEKDLMHLSLFDPKNAESAEASINIALVRDGLARVDARSRLREVAPKAALQAAILEAKRSRAGAYELGDIFDD